MRAKGQFWGSVITDDEVDALLQAHGEIDLPLATPDGLENAVVASAALRDDPRGRFARLRKAFHLDGDDADLLLLSMAPEISAGYGRIFAYLNDNLNQAFLTVDLATRILRTHRTERLGLQARMMSGAPLIRNRLLLLDPPEGAETHTARRVHPSGRLLQWLMEEVELPAGIGFTPMDISRAPLIPGPTRTRIAEIAPGLDRAVTVAVVGGTMGAREGAAVAIARAAGRTIARVDLERCAQYLEQPWDLIRELRLSNALPYVVNVMNTQEDPALRNQVTQLGGALATLPFPVLIGGSDRRAIGTLLGGDRPSITVQVHRTNLHERIDAWTDAFASRGWTTEYAHDLSERFYSVGGTTIDRVMERAEAECGGRAPSQESLWAAARECSRPEFRGLATHIIPRYQWNDLIISEKVRDQMQHIINFLAEQENVFHRWGANKVRARGYGIKALFSGGPGTGKTMAAEVIAGTLGLDLFRVDLSSVVSRWVGETEKNLREIFDAAEGGTAVVLFDEADALFARRGEVQDAHDRNANLEVGYLLQRMEDFNGLAILTTNMADQLDGAFQRRIRAHVRFAFPDAAQRAALWLRVFPEGVPTEGLDPERLAQLQLSGAGVRAVATRAAFRAARRARQGGAPAAVTMDDLREAAIAELAQQGRPVSERELRGWG